MKYSMIMKCKTVMKYRIMMYYREMTIIRIIMKKQNKVDYKEIISWIKYIGSAILIALFLTNFVIINAYIPSGSMENTIMTKDRVIASRLHYLFTDPKRGDIVVFKFPDDEKTNFVKRVIGLPGGKRLK